MSEVVISQPAPQPPTPAAAPATPQTAEPKPGEASDRLSALIKREQALVRKQQELKRQEEEWTKRSTDYKSWDERLNKAKANPIEGVKDLLGLSYDDLTKYILNDNKPTPDLEVKSVKDELRALREEHERRIQEERERQAIEQKQQAEAQVEQFKVDLSDYIMQNTDKYELLSHFGEDGVELVFETIKANWQEKLNKYEEGGRIGRPPKIMSSEEACKLIEDWYEGQFDQGFEKSKKLQSRYQKAQAAAQAANAQPAGEKPLEAMARTLNQSMTSPSAPSALPAQTEADRIARALAALD